MTTLRSIRPAPLTLAAVVFTASAELAAAQAPPTQDPIPVEVQGSATFDVGTNVPALSVHGKSTELQARGRVRRGANGPQLEHLEATMPVKSLNTGMGLRDSHMRKYIFTTPDGQTPDVKFTATRASCTAAGDNLSTCHVTGDLSIRGTVRPFAIAMKVTENDGTYRASGDGIVKLSAYGIPQPSQLGVRTDDEIKLKLEFTARPAPVATSGVKTAAKRGGQR
jgi:polyisoprenoid-binding protein YceI